MTAPRALEVYYGSAHVGTVHDSLPLAFHYAPAWLARADAFALGAIGLARGRIATGEVTAVFENLLPEGDQRVFAARQHKASTLFSLLLALAGDTAGAFVLLPPGERPAPPAYRATTWAALAHTIRQQSAAAIQGRGGRTRISLAGAQDKASIALWGDGVPHLPLGTAPSTHILKPDIRRLPKVYESAANEAIVMRAAQHCGLNVAAVFYEPHTRACVVQRFDRVRLPGGELARLVQYDFCQLLGLGSERKYEKEGGPTLADCAALVRRFSASPALDMQALARWVLFNLYTGNNDSHAKNLSLYHRTGAGVRLTPFYDLMCTRLYPGLADEFAFSLAGQSQPGQFGPAHLNDLAAQLGVNARYLRLLATELAERLPAALAQARADVAPALSPSGAGLADKLALKIRTLTRQSAARLLG
ncbi:MAG: type II toxin-antitoxin system HipA family toxin [Pseudomonadota bacterium]|nr:type II toxin-antitoxin system HipA family toxin [Pseudomonadota bacterium]